MAKVYISYNQRDSELAQALAAKLQQRGHNITIDIASLSAGSDWRAVLNEALKQSDVFVAILTENALTSQFVASEIGTARAFAQAAGDMLIVPVIADKMEVPPFVSDLFAILAPDRDIERIAAEIDRAIAAFVGQKAAREKKQEVQNAQVHANIAEYVDEAIISLRKNDARDRRAATIWYWVGLAALIAGIVFGFLSLHDVVTASRVSGTGSAALPPANALAIEWLLFARAVLKAAVVIGLLLAITKYCFVLGKAHMSEALKSGDRVHAIAYGKFYLRAFGAQADPQQLKEVFQYWNIDRPSAFGSTGTEQFDPKFVESLVEIAKAAAKSGDPKK